MMMLVSVLLAAVQGAGAADFGPGRTRWVFATVQHSEWCPSGNIRIDLGDGRYEFTARAPRRACGTKDLERPVLAGRLGSKRLAAIRAAYGRVLREGFESAACADGAQPENIVISNGGTQVLVIATGAWTRSASEDLSCWSEAANDFHRILDETADHLRTPGG